MKISDKTVIQLLPLENDVLDRTLAEKDNGLSLEEISILEQQFAEAIILSRKMTGHGFYVDFLVDEKSPRLDKKSLHLGRVGANISGMEHGAGFILFITNGAVSALEGFAYDEPWPDPWPNTGQSPTYELFNIPRT